MLKDSTFLLLPQGNNKASAEQTLCNYKYRTDHQDQGQILKSGGCRSTTQQFIHDFTRTFKQFYRNVWCQRFSPQQNFIDKYHTSINKPNKKVVKATQLEPR